MCVPRAIAANVGQVLLLVSGCWISHPPHRQVQVVSSSHVDFYRKMGVGFGPDLEAQLRADNPNPYFPGWLCILVFQPLFWELASWLSSDSLT